MLVTARRPPARSVIQIPGPTVALRWNRSRCLFDACCDTGDGCRRARNVANGGQMTHFFDALYGRHHEPRMPACDVTFATTPTCPHWHADQGSARLARQGPGSNFGPDSMAIRAHAGARASESPGRIIAAASDGVVPGPPSGENPRPHKRRAAGPPAHGPAKGPARLVCLVWGGSATWKHRSSAIGTQQSNYLHRATISLLNLHVTRGLFA